MVNLAISEALYARHPDDDEGYLSARRAAIVSTTGLARLAGRIDLGSYLLLGEGEAQRNGRRRPSLLASTFEAVVGALYLDLGFATVSDWVVGLAGTELVAESPIGALKSPRAGSRSSPSVGQATDRRTSWSTRPDRITRSRSGSRSGSTARCSARARVHRVGRPRQTPRPRRWTSSERRR